MKKGFTLAEMIGVVVIISLLVILITPAMSNFVFKSREKLSDATMQIINASASLYMSDHYSQYNDRTGSIYCVQLQTLVDKDYLKEPLYDSKTNQNVDLSKYVKITYSSEWNFEYVSSCMEIIDDGSTDVTYFVWTETSTEATVMGFSSSKPAGLKNIKIPSKYNGKPVTAIGNSAFINQGLVSVELPENLVTIGTSAFENNDIAGNLVIPNKVTTIGGKAFYMNEITSIRFSNIIQSIGTYAFRDNLIVTLVLPDSLTSIGTYSFYNNKIETLKIGSGLTVISTQAFYNNFIKELEIPNNITTIQTYAFYNNSIEKLKLGTGLITIDTYAFGLNLLKSLTIPNNVVTINTLAFYRNKLETIYIGSGVNTIGGGAFAYNRSGYNNITNIEINSNKFKVLDGVLYNSDYTVLISALTNKTSVVIPNQVTTVSDYAFQYNNLTSLTFNNSVIDIGSYAFAYNYISNTLTFPNTLTTINTLAFCSNSLSTITIPNSVTTISTRVFEGNRLSTVSLGAGVTSIGTRAFYKSSASSTSGNGPLSTIFNFTGRSFDWDSIVNAGTGGLYTFAGGTVVSPYGNVTVVILSS